MPTALLDEIDQAPQGDGGTAVTTPGVAKLSDIADGPSSVAKLSDIVEEPKAAPPSIIDRAKTMAQQVRGVGSDIVDAAQRPVAGLPEHLGEKIIRPWTEAAKSLVQEATGPLENVPGGPWLRRALHEAIDKGGESAAGALDFITTPLGIATAPAAASEGLVGGAVRSAFAGSQVPKTAETVATAVADPTPEHVAGAVVSTAAVALPMAPELAAGAGRVVETGKTAAGVLERHNIEAARLVEAERARGMGQETGEQVLGSEGMPVKVGDKTVTVRAAGGSEAGRPFYQVIGEDGKPVYAGFGQNVQDYLRQQGARPVNEAAPARYPESQPTGTEAPGVQLNAPSPRKTAAPASVPEEGAPENVARAQDARERLAPELAGKPWKDLSNSERLVVDEFVSQGYGFAVRPGEGATPPAEPYATTHFAPTIEAAKSEARTAPLADIVEPANPADNISAESKESAQSFETAGVQQERQPAPDMASLPVRTPATAPAYGREVTIAVPGGKASYPARYAVREADDVQASHNAQSFEANPNYQHTNDRDYSQIENAARVVTAAQDFRPEFVLAESPTAEHGPSIIDRNGNALGGNNRAMAIQRVYQSGDPQAAAEYRNELQSRAQQFGIDPKELSRFKNPVLVRELTQPLGKASAANAITDFNKTSAAWLSPAEQAVSDGRRLSAAAMREITGRMEDQGEEGTLAQALRGDDGAQVLARLVKDGLLTEQEKNGYIDERGFLTPEIKDRIAKALVGRLYSSPKEMQSTPPELRGKIERIAPQVLRVEDRKGWGLTRPVKEAIVALSDARAHGITNLDDLAKQTSVQGTEYSPVAIRIAKKIQEGPLAAQRAFRMYANDEALSREGAQTSLYEPPSHREAFDAAFGAETTAKRRQSNVGGAADYPVNGRGVESKSLFDERTEEESGKAAISDQAKLTKARLEAQLNAPISREEQLKRLRQGKTPPQTNFFESTDEEPQSDLFGGERGAVSPDLLSLGLTKFVAEDVAPAVKDAGKGVVEATDDILKILVPAARGKSAQQAALIMRNRLSELARKSDRAEAAMAVARKYFYKAGDAAGKKFILDYFADETGVLPQKGNRELDAIARVLRAILDARRGEVQALGKGKLQGFFTNYFPRIWKDQRKAEGVFVAFFGRRPLEGGKSFLKQRKYPTIQDALTAGLEPISWNPIDLVLLKTREMDRYVMAHQVLEDWKRAALAKYVDARTGKAPHGWMKIADPIGTVYGPSIQHINEFPNEGLYRALEATAQALGISHKRGFEDLHEAVGRASKGAKEVKTMHGTAEDVLAHEIGHQIDWLAGSGNRFITEFPDAGVARQLKQAYAAVRDKSATPDQRTQARKTLKALQGSIQLRKQMGAELRALADLRSGNRAYTHKREEKMALLAEMWVGARPLFERTAPLAFAEWTRFLDETPKLKALRDIEGNTEVTRISQPYDVGGLVIRGNWYAPEGAARIMNNYLSPGLRSRSGAYRAVLGLNNVLNQFQLGLSAFHLGFTSADAAVSQAALSYEAAFRGKPLQAAKLAAGVPIAPLTTFLQGSRVLREWYRPGSQGGAIAKIVEGLELAGGRARMDQVYQTAIGDRMRHAFRNGNIWGGLLRSPFAAVEAVSNVMMKELVPRQKLGVFSQLAAFEMERLGPGARFDETREAMAKAWDSVDNRMGEMVYDNLFWDRTTKDLAMISVRSVGWNLGTIREVGGGAVDLIRIPAQIAGGKPPGSVSLHRVAYLMGLVTVSAVMGALYQYLHTGKGPTEAKDYFFPKTGELDQAGRPRRASLPTYVKDVYHYSTEPGKTIANKVAPIWNLFAEMIANEDFYGTEIRNADDPLVKQMLDSVGHLAESMKPFGIRNVQQDIELGTPMAQRAERFVGVTPAPSAIERTKAERLASELAKDRIPAGGRTSAEAARRDAERTISRLAQQGKDYADHARDYLASGALTAKDVHAAAKRSSMPPLLRTFQNLPIEDALQVWDAASLEERAQLRPMLRKKMSSIAQLPEAQRRIVLPKLQAALAAASGR